MAGQVKTFRHRAEKFVQMLAWVLKAAADKLASFACILAKSFGPGWAGDMLSPRLSRDKGKDIMLYGLNSRSTKVRLTAVESRAKTLSDH
jgi:hypothetical protein